MRLDARRLREMGPHQPIAHLSISLHPIAKIQRISLCEAEFGYMVDYEGELE